MCVGGGGVGWLNQAYSRLSTTHGHITDCKLDSVVYAGVIYMWDRLTFARQKHDTRHTMFNVQLLE